MCGHIDPHFSTRSHPQTPFLNNNSQPIFDNLSPNDPLFLQHFDKFSIFFGSLCQKCVQICIRPGKLVKICLILIIWPLHSFGPLTEWPLFWRKISHRKTRFKLLSKHPYNVSLPKLSATRVSPFAKVWLCYCKFELQRSRFNQCQD